MLPAVQSNYSSTVTLHGGPVVLRPVNATPCYITLSGLFVYCCVVFWYRWN